MYSRPFSNEVNSLSKSVVIEKTRMETSIAGKHFDSEMDGGINDDDDKTRRSDQDDYLIRGIMKKHEDHVRVLEALIYSQETLINVKDAKIEELEDRKQQLEHLVGRLQDNQLFHGEQANEWEQERTVLEREKIRLEEENSNLVKDCQRLKTAEQQLKTSIDLLTNENRILRQATVDDVSASAKPSSHHTAQHNQQIQAPERCDVCEELKDTLKRTITSHEHAEQLLQKKQSEVDECNQIIDQLQTKLQSSEASRAAQQLQIEDLKTAVMRYQTDNVDALSFSPFSNKSFLQLPSDIRRRISVKVCLLQRMSQSGCRAVEQRRRLRRLISNASASTVKPITELTGSRAVYGLALLGQELFVVRWECAGVIDVYDVTDNADSCCLVRRLDIQLETNSSLSEQVHTQQSNAGRLRRMFAYFRSYRSQAKTELTSSAGTSQFCQIRPTDIVATMTATATGNDGRHLFVNDLANCMVHRIRPTDGHVTLSWTVDGGAYGLSMTSRQTVLVCCTGSAVLAEYDADSGKLVRSVALNLQRHLAADEVVAASVSEYTDGFVQPWHAIDVIGSWIVCHGGRYWDDESNSLKNDKHHRVCKLDVPDTATKPDAEPACVRAVHGREPGSADDQVYYPLYMVAVGGGTGYLLLADCDNDRIKILDDRLKCVSVLALGQRVKAPYRLCICRQSHRLFVGLASGMILIYRLGDLLSSEVFEKLIETETHPNGDADMNNN